MNQKGFLFNPNRCLGCRACQIACSSYHGLSPGVYLRKVTDIEFIKNKQVVKFSLSSSCNHCLNPECFRLCPEHAYRKRRDGIVTFDPNQCKGCGTCTRSCPFEAPVVNPLTGKVIKCDLCFGRLEEGESPYCVSSCPVNALQLLVNVQADPPNIEWEKTLPGVPKIQLTRPAIRYFPLKMGRQTGLQQSMAEGGKSYEP